MNWPAGFAQQEVEVGLERRVQRHGFALQVVHRVALHTAGLRVEEAVADVGAAVLRHHGGLARGHVLRQQRGGVAAAGVQPVEGFAVGGVVQRLGGLAVFQAHADDGRGVDLVVADAEVVGAAGGIRAAGQAQVQVAVGVEAAVAVVLQHQRELAAGQVEAVHVMETRVAVVQADEDAVLHLGADADDAHHGLLERRVALLRAAWPHPHRRGGSSRRRPGR